MNANTVVKALLIGMCMTAATAQGQDLSPPTQAPVWDAPRNSAGMIAPDAAGEASAVPPGASAPLNQPPSGGLSDWILYRRCESCWGPTTATPSPLCMELFFRGGVNVAVGGTKLGRDLQTGFAVMGGGRALLYNPETTHAYTLEAHLINLNNSAAGQNPAAISVFENNAQGTATRVNFGTGTTPPVTISRYNQTLVGLGLGEEYYFVGSARDPGTKWRMGYDAGGRYGSAKIDLNETRHRTDVIAALYVAAHTDMEIPCGPCSFVAGLRFEWSYTWSDILQRATDVQNLTTMANFGLRY